MLHMNKHTSGMQCQLKTLLQFNGLDVDRIPKYFLVVNECFFLTLNSFVFLLFFLGMFAVLESKC